MGHNLADGTVVMSNFGLRDTASSSSSGREAMAQHGVFIGEVVDILYPENPVNVAQFGGTEVIYWVQIRKPGQTPALWPCRMAIGVESLADFDRTNLRPASKDGDLVGDGAKVLVSCANGNVREAFIIGCQRMGVRKDRAQKGTRRGNREMEREFNGFRTFVNDAGEVKLQVSGPTKNDGSPDNREDTQKGAYIQFNKAGDLTASDNNGQSITLNSKDKAITILAKNVARIDAKKIYVGAESASENLVLGQQMVEAMSSLIMDVFIKGAGNLGKCAVGPVILDPSMAAALLQWKLKWMTEIGGPAKVLSSKAFTER